MHLPTYLQFLRLAGVSSLLYTSHGNGTHCAVIPLVFPYQKMSYPIPSMFTDLWCSACWWMDAPVAALPIQLLWGLEDFGLKPCSISACLIDLSSCTLTVALYSACVTNDNSVCLPQWSSVMINTWKPSEVFWYYRSSYVSKIER